MVELAPRAVTIEALSVTRFTPPEIDLNVVCSAGTYIRSLAFDLGRALGSAAHLIALRRTAAGGLTLADALPLSAFEAGGRDLIEERLLAPDRALLDRPVLVLDEAAARRLENGVRPSAPPTTNGIVRVYDAAGGFLATLRAEDGQWRDAKVFALA